MASTRPIPPSFDAPPAYSRSSSDIEADRLLKADAYAIKRGPGRESSNGSVARGGKNVTGATALRGGSI